MPITLATTTEALKRCHPVMAELRPHLSEQQFMDQVLRQQREGYHLAMLEEGNAVRALAGFRFLEMLAFGKILYVDDLVTHSAHRSRGHGKQLFEWLVQQARNNHCAQLHLDSGVQRHDAHRFYLTQRMDINSHHFALKL